MNTLYAHKSVSDALIYYYNMYKLSRIHIEYKININKISYNEINSVNYFK